MGRSPAHYLHQLHNPMEPTAAMQIGTAIHAAVLGGAAPIIYPGASRRGKAWDEFKLVNEGRLILNETEADTVARVVGAIVENPNAMIVLKGEREKMVKWNHGDRACQSTPDVHSPGSHITDLKTCKSAKPNDFLWQAKKLCYHSQLAFYDAAVGGVPDHYIVAAETSPPYPVVVYRIARSTIEMGAALWRSWFERLRVCEDSNDWPGYSRLIEDLEFPQEGDGLDWEGVE
jgi:hypothetical protein